MKEITKRFKKSISILLVIVLLLGTPIAHKALAAEENSVVNQHGITVSTSIGETVVDITDAVV